MSLLHVSDDGLTQICTFVGLAGLMHLSHTSRSVMSMLKSPSVAIHLDFVEHRDILDEGVCILIEKWAEQIQTVYFTACRRVGSKSLMSLSLFCPRLRKLNLIGCSVEMEAINELIEKTPLLEELAMSECCDADEFLLTLSESCPRLEVLVFTASDEDLREGLKALSSQCTSLRACTLFFDQVDPNALLGLQSLPSLRKLYLHQYSPSAAEVRHLSEVCAHLTSLHLSEPISMDSMKALSVFTRLERLELGRVPFPLPLDGMRVFASAFPSLRALYLSAPSYSSWVELEGQSLLYSDGFRNPVRVYHDASRVVQVQVSDFEWISCLASSSPHLEELSVSLPEGKPNDFLCKCLAACYFPKLRNLTLENGVTSASALLLVPLLPQLTELWLSSCPAVEDVVVQAIAQHGTRLKVLILSGLPLITDLGCRALTALGPQLEHLDMSYGFELVTTKCLNELLAACVKLTVFRPPGLCFNDSSTEVLCGACGPRLREMSVAETSVTARSIYKLGDCAPALENLDGWNEDDDAFLYVKAKCRRLWTAYQD